MNLWNIVNKKKNKIVIVDIFDKRDTSLCYGKELLI